MKCPKCGSTKIARERRPNGDDICGSCHHRWPSRETKERPKPEVAKQTFTPEELLKIWASDTDLEALILVGIPKSGGWKYAMSESSFEFLAAAEGVIQKVKLNALDLIKK